MKVDIEQLKQYEKDGYVRSQTDGGVIVWTYHDKATWEKFWPPLLRQARGLVTTQDGTVVAKPFDKFFNYGEMPETTNLPKEGYQIYEKLDGSLISLAMHPDGHWKPTTKGSLDNIYIDYARELIDFEALKSKWSHMEEMTICCEIVLPPDKDTMRRVVDHEPGLYFLAAFNREDGQDYTSLFRGDPHYALDLHNMGIKFAQEFTVSLEDLMSEGAKEKGTEGWVVVFESGLRVKLKTYWYLALFRYLNSLDESYIKQCLINNEDDGWMMSIPEEFREEVEVLIASIKERYKVAEEEIERVYKECYSTVRKEYALKVKDLPNAFAYFHRYDNKDFRAKLMEVV